MAIYHYPEGDRASFDMIRSFRPQCSSTVVWVQDMATNRLVRILRWGREFYLPVYDGMKIGVGVYNGDSNPHAYPLFVEGRNIWDGGSSEPEQCDTDHMWELRGYERMVMDKLMNPQRPAGRPLIITSSGQGLNIGEATFGTDKYRGQIRLYERLVRGGGHQTYRQTNAGSAMRGGPSRGGLESFSTGSAKSLRGGGSVTLGMEDVESRGPAGIGAGEEEYQHHFDTGLIYQTSSQPVIYLRVEYREDIQPLLNVAWRNTPSWSWYEDLPIGDSWWDNPWTWHRPTAPGIPVTRPHRGR